MQIRIPDELAAEAFRLLARPTHHSLTPFVNALLRREISAHKTLAESSRRALNPGLDDDSEARAAGGPR